MEKEMFGNYFDNFRKHFFCTQNSSGNKFHFYVNSFNFLIHSGFNITIWIQNYVFHCFDSTLLIHNDQIYNIEKEKLPLNFSRTF